jgi:hypothetical protein
VTIIVAIALPRAIAFIGKIVHRSPFRCIVPHASDIIDRSANPKANARRRVADKIDPSAARKRRGAPWQKTFSSFPMARAS